MEEMRGLLGQRGGTYLWVLQAVQVRVQVEPDARRSAGQRDAADQQHDEHDEGEGGCDVDHLRGHREVRSHVAAG